MKTIESTGKNLDEALALGLKTLGVTKEEVTYEVLSQNETETKVKITIKEPRQYLIALTNYFLSNLGFRTNITVIRDEQGFTVNIKTKQVDTPLIGKNGETLWALQYLISRLARRFYSNIKVLVDINGYRAKQNNFLKKKAEAIARIVLQTGREMALDPMTHRQEKIVINTVNEIKEVKTYTIGKGKNRTLVIAPKTEKIEEKIEQDTKE
uniref:R3H domain-containing protein n=1 Tax=candidate division WOR-3 bacterium TaxID=2052148 RepID=A0A7C4TI57_UNCW3